MHSLGISPSIGQGSHKGFSLIYIPGGHSSGITAQYPDSPLVSPSGQGPKIESHSPVVGSSAKFGGHSSEADAARSSGWSPSETLGVSGPVSSSACWSSGWDELSPSCWAKACPIGKEL
jgi:hypothetical protein